MLLSSEPFASMKPKHRTRMIHKESLIVGYEPEAALAALPKLLRTDEEREQALPRCEQIAGPRGEMSPETIDMINRLALALDQDPVIAPTDPASVRQIA
jgi:hypothetical protein